MRFDRELPRILHPLAKALPEGPRRRLLRNFRFGSLLGYEWDLEQARMAIARDPKNRSNQEQLSRAFARLERWDEAAEALSRAVQTEGEFRFRSKSTCPAGQKCFKAAKELARSQAWRQAAETLRMTLDRCDEARDNLFIDLAKLHLRDGKPEAAMGAFRMSAIERCVELHSSGEADIDQELTRTRSNAIYRNAGERRDDVILYESFHGKSITCNPAAMLRAALESPSFRGHTHVVVLNDPTRLPRDLAERPNVVIVARESNRYRYFLNTAGHLINNNTFPAYFCRHQFQKYLNTWHGTPMKTLGRFVGGKIGEHRNAQHNFLHATHILSQNAFTTDQLIRAHDIPSRFTGKFANTGYPRVDAVITASAETKSALRSLLGIPAGRKVIFYAPTWRGGLSARETTDLRTTETLERLSEAFGGEVAVIYRGHHLTPASKEGGRTTRWITAPEVVDTNDILSICDLLVSDYSSVIFDFMPLGRPVLLYAYDLDEYEATRGFCLHPRDVGVPVCQTLDDLMERIGTNASDDHTKCAAYCGMEDGRSTERAMAFFFEDDPGHVMTRNDPRKSLLFFGGGFRKNGVTISLLSRLQAIDHDRYEVILVVMTQHLGEDPERVLHFRRLHPEVKVIDRGGKFSSTLLEHRLNVRSADQPDIGPELRKLYEWEALRVFGGSLMFDVAIDYSGYARYWALLLGIVPAARRLIYLHNDMVAERNLRFSDLDSVFSCYRLYDALVSVSASSLEVNRRFLSHLTAGGRRSFIHVPNPVDFEEIRERAKSRCDAADKLPSGAIKFVNVARLSPEKGQDRLLRAFARALKNQTGITLHLVGDGPQREQLEKLATKLRLGDSVRFHGLLDNPLPVVAACDVFIFSSVHEGQGLALIEALALGKTAVSTDIPGPRDVLAQGSGLLVADSEDGLLEGILQCAAGWKPISTFNEAGYNAESSRLFEAALESRT